MEEKRPLSLWTCQPKFVREIVLIVLIARGRFVSELGMACCWINNLSLFLPDFVKAISDL